MYSGRSGARSPAVLKSRWSNDGQITPKKGPLMQRTTFSKKKYNCFYGKGGVVCVIHVQSKIGDNIRIGWSFK